MEFEPPVHLLGRLKIGREEFCQRMLTTLILHAPYPPWNSRSHPAPAGLAFLADLYRWQFDGDELVSPVIFVDEFELAPRHSDEKGGGPDYAVLWDRHVWLIELKTEKGSHRPQQIPGYFELAHHHYPLCAVDVLYVTPPMEVPHVPSAKWARYAHTTWLDILPLIHKHWPTGTAPGEQQVIDGLDGTIRTLDLKPAVWRSSLLRESPGVPSATKRRPAESVTLSEPVQRALEAARQTATDHQQRPVDYLPSDLEDLLTLRVAVRRALAATPVGSPLRHVAPWIWRPESSGRPLSISGREHGFELRLSYHKKPQY
jgi:hypothetical protein